jgi:hypothetical protein
MPGGSVRSGGSLHGEYRLPKQSFPEGDPATRGESASGGPALRLSRPTQQKRRICLAPRRVRLARRTSNLAVNPPPADPLYRRAGPEASVCPDRPSEHAHGASRPTGSRRIPEELTPTAPGLSSSAIARRRARPVASPGHRYDLHRADRGRCGERTHRTQSTRRICLAPRRVRLRRRTSNLAVNPPPADPLYR